MLSGNVQFVAFKNPCSQKVSLPVEKYSDVSILSLDQHEPGRSWSHSFSTGQHWSHCSVALTPKTMLTEMITNHTATFTQPWETRNSVRANDVLLHAAAKIDANPVAYEQMTKSLIFSGLTSWFCLPRSTLTPADWSDAAAARATYRKMVISCLRFPHIRSTSAARFLPSSQSGYGHPTIDGETSIICNTSAWT
jgi:hypothetical protein